MHTSGCEPAGFAGKIFKQSIVTDFQYRENSEVRG
jgi:hypothetical protein